MRPYCSSPAAGRTVAGSRAFPRRGARGRDARPSSRGTCAHVGAAGLGPGGDAARTSGCSPCRTTSTPGTCRWTCRIAPGSGLTEAGTPGSDSGTVYKAYG